MSQLVQNKTTGEYAVYDATRGLIPISDLEAEQMQKGRLARTAGSFGDTVLDSVGGALEMSTGGNRESDIFTRAVGTLLNPVGGLLGMAGVNPVAGVGQRIQQSNDARQAARFTVDPFASNVGAGAAIGTEMLLPVPKSGALTKLTKGAQRGVDAADAAIDAASARTAARTQRRTDDSLSAGRNPNPTFARGERELRGLASADQMESLGFRLTPAERRALDATNRAELDAANRARDREDLFSSVEILPASDAKLADVPYLNRYSKDDQKAAFTKYVANQLDEPNVETLTRKRLGDIMDDTQEVFRELIDRNTAPVEIGEVKKVVDEAVETAGINSQRQLERLQKRLDKAFGDDRMVFKDGEFSSLSTDVNRQIKNAFNNGNYELGMALSQVKTALDDALERVMVFTNPEGLAQLREARRKYGLIKTLQAGRATDPSGTVNPATFRNNFAKMSRSYATGKRDDEFSQVLDAAVYLTSRQTGDSGTAARMAAKAIKPTIGGAGLYGGGSLLLGE